MKYPNIHHISKVRYKNVILIFKFKMIINRNLPGGYRIKITHLSMLLKFFIIFKTQFLVIKKWLSQKTEKTCKMKTNYPSIWKFKVHIFWWWVMSVQIFRKIHAPISKYRYMRGQNHVHGQGTERRTDGHRQSDRWTEWKQYTPKLCLRGL